LGGLIVETISKDLYVFGNDCVLALSRRRQHDGSKCK
jgi:hypothetical protein